MLSSFTKIQTILLMLAAMAFTWFGFSIQLKYYGGSGGPLQTGSKLSSADALRTPDGLPITAEQKSLDIDFPTFSVTGTVKEVKSGLIKVEVTGFSAPGVTEIREVEISGNTKITLIMVPKILQTPPLPPQEISPKPTDKPAATQTQPIQPPKGTAISVNDIKVGDRVSASSGKLDIQRKMRFTAVSVTKLVDK